MFEELKLHRAHVQVIGVVLHEGVQAISGIVVEKAHGTDGAVEFRLHTIGIMVVGDALHHAFEAVLGRAVFGLIE